MPKPHLAIVLLAFTVPALAADPPLLKVPARSMRAEAVAEQVVVDGKTVTRTREVPVLVETLVGIDPAKTAVVICDLWDDHWCPTAAERCGALAKKAAPVVAACRKAGVTVIHCPSDCMDYYKDSPARKRAQEAKAVEPPKAKVIDAPALPIDDSDGGCDVPEPVKFRKAWTRQHEAVPVDEAADYVTDKGAEVYNVLRAKGITQVLVMGVHTNMCVLNRSFAIKQLRRWDVDCLLVRDLTDAMYNPKMKPFVTHDEGTQLVVEHIERYWCPTVESAALPGGKK